MIRTPVHYPLDGHLQKGISAAQAIELLRYHDCLTFPQLRSGLFPAAHFDDVEKDETGMANAWLRDTACVGMVLLGTDQRDAAMKAAQAVVARLQAIRPSFEKVITMGHAPADDKDRPPVRFAGQDSVPRYDWANAQNDALGYSLQFMAAARHIDKSLIDTIVTYLETVQYWRDADSGHWEEVKKINASSIGTVVAGLRAIRDNATSTPKVLALIDKGNQALNDLLPAESGGRPYDAALVFLVEPQRVVGDGMAARIIAQTEQHLMGDHGFRRYRDDSYWGPDYREHFQLGARTADFSQPENMALRDSYLTAGSEAQWTLIDPLIAAYYARQGNADKATHFMARALKNIVVHGDSWRVPELFFLEKGEWLPNDHLGLLWAQANVLYGLQVYKEAFGDMPMLAG
jgi:GH15 family glucan-1,4-alpha-glucosidase